MNRFERHIQEKRTTQAMTDLERDIGELVRPHPLTYRKLANSVSPGSSMTTVMPPKPSVKDMTDAIDSLDIRVLEDKFIHDLMASTADKRKQCEELIKRYQERIVTLGQYVEELTEAYTSTQVRVSHTASRHVDIERVLANWGAKL